MGTSTTATLYANLLADEKSFKTSRYWRRVARVGLAGSTAMGDHEVQLWFGKRQIAILRCSTVNSDVMPTDDDMKPISEPALCPPGTDMILQITDAGAGQPINWILEVQELPELGLDPRFPRRRYSRSRNFRRRAY